MKLFKMTVPYSFTVEGDYEHEIPETEVLEAFGVDSLDEIAVADLESYLKDTADEAAYDISDTDIALLVSEQKGLRVYEDHITIDEEDIAE